MNQTIEPGQKKGTIHGALLILNKLINEGLDIVEARLKELIIQYQDLVSSRSP